MSADPKKVMVIGGGIAGLTAAWELSKCGVLVDLVEKSDHLGGHAIQYCCKATDECRQCGACSVEKMLKNVVEAPNINVHCGVEVDRVARNGRFEVSLQPSGAAAPAASPGCRERYETDPLACAAARKFSKNNAALDCGGTAADLKVDAIVLASGFAPFDATRKGTYNYGKLPNVVTGLELERGVRANGRVLRPSDGKPPAKVAFIQCVGSRDERLGNLWCSHVCCPYALRAAELMKHHNPEVEITVFYMDIQNTGNNFPAFYEKCKQDLQFVRNIPVDIYPMEDDRLRMRYTAEADGSPVDAEFDLVVLSIGIMPGLDNQRMATLLNIGLDADGFFQSSDSFHRTATTNNGVFLAGTVGGPKTIAASMAHAGQAAYEAMKYLGGGE